VDPERDRGHALTSRGQPPCGGADRLSTGRFLITGSQDFSLMEGVTESLAGRIISQTIVTPDRGSRRASETVTIADSATLAFLSSS
jgi:hypothetical protein